MIQEKYLTSGQKSGYFCFPYELAAGIYHHSSPNACNKQFAVSAGHSIDKICLSISRCSNQLLSSYFFNENPNVHRRDLNYSLSLACHQQLSTEPQGWTPKGSNRRLQDEPWPLGSPWGYSYSLNFRRLKEAQVKGVFADQSQNPDHLTTLLNNNIFKLILP